MCQPDPSRLPALARLRALGAALALLALLPGCGGGGGSDSTPPPPPAPNQVPVGSFSAAASVEALLPLALDASASSDADNDPLLYHWDFGDGTRGGGMKVAHTFAAAGNYTVRLTVSDGRGGLHAVERVVNVSASPAPLATVNAQVLVRGLDGALLSGVSVAAVGASAAPVLTDAQGQATLAVGTAVKQLLKFSKAGYSDQFRDAALPASAESGYLEVTMQPREPALTLADAAAGGTLTGKDGASVTFPPNALVDANGNPVSGPVSVAMTPVDIARNVQAFPGRFAGVRGDGQQGLLLSYGTVEYALSANGQPVQLAPARKATIEIPVYAALHRDGTAMKVGDTSPLWSLDERTGAWTEEGQGTVVAANTPSGFALRGEVQHFTWWNHDQFDFPPARPKPRCLVDTNADGILEDLTGTGHCWHAGTGPEQPNTFAMQAARPAPASVRKDGARILADAVTQRIPAYAAWASTPAAGGQVLPIPANMDITFRSYAMNGSLFGMKVVNLGPDVEQEVVIVLAPVQRNPGTRAITLPHDDLYRMDTQGEVDRFTFAAEAGATYRVSVVRGPSSTLGGSVRVLAPGGAQLNGGPFGANGFLGTATPSGAGTMTVEVQANSQAPGSYRIEVTRLSGAGSCASPVALGLPATAANFSVPANGGIRCFALALAADDVLEIKTTQNLSAEGTIALISPSGLQVASDTYGTGSFDGMLLKAAIAEAGTWRLEITNTRTTNGTIVGLSTVRLPVAATLNVPESAAFAAPSTNNDDRYYVIKPATARPHIVLTLDGKNINQGLRVEPMGLDFGDSTAQARIVPTIPGVHLLVRAFRRSASTAWDYTLATSDPQTPALDADIALNPTSAGIVAVYGLSGGAGQQISLGRSTTGTATPILELYAPGTGARLSQVTEGAVYPLDQSGPYTLVVRNNTTTGGAMTVRINTLSTPEAVAATPGFERTVNLRLGEVKRYSFNATQGQLLALGLSSPQALDATAVLVGGNVYDGGVVLFGGPAPRSAQTTPRYVQTAGPVELKLYSASNQPANATGEVTVKLQSPAPVPVALGALIDATFAPGVLVSRSFNIAAAGPHMLCMQHGSGLGTGGTALDAKVWGPSAPFSNYGAGDLQANTVVVSNTTSIRTEDIASLRAGAQTLTLMPSVSSAVPAQLRLAALPAPTSLALGAAATGGTLAPCTRGAHRFDGVVGQSYTVRVTAAFNGALRVRKQPPNGDPYGRVDPPFSTGNLGGTPLALTAGVERVLSFTIPSTAPFANGVYVVEVGDAEDGGAYTVQVTSP